MVQACQARAGEQGVSAPRPGPPISMGYDGSVLGSRSRSRVRGLLEGATLSLVLRGVLCAFSPLPSPERSSRWRSCPRSEDLSSGSLGMGGSRVLACPLMCSCCARLARVCRCVIGLVCSRPPSFLGSPSDFSSLRRVVPRRVGAVWRCRLACARALAVCVACVWAWARTNSLVQSQLSFTTVSDASSLSSITILSDAV